MSSICGLLTCVSWGSLVCFTGYEDVLFFDSGLRTDDIFLSFTFQRDPHDLFFKKWLC